MKHTNEEFIEKAHKVHGDKYDYSLVEYNGAHSKIKFICEKHGVFTKEASKAFKKEGICKECYGYNRLTTEEFIKKAKLIHGDKYDYSLVEYVNNSTNIKLMCKEHGEFKQIPNNHLNGNGCPKCSKNLQLNNESFIIKANLVHENKYDYSYIKYNGSHTNINIYCNTHGEFKQTPTNHLSGNGCPVCGYVGASEKNKIDKNEFILRANIIHGNKYDYINSEPNGFDNKIKIICKKHGQFEQIIGNHLSGKGCKLCNESKGELGIKKYLEKNKIEFTREKTFDNCKNILKLPFDFHLPEKNLLIEFDGKQHFNSIKYFGGEEGFKKTKANDEIKNCFAKENNINLLRIRYDEINNIEEILNKYI